jgi:hypothetical protein
VSYLEAGGAPIHELDSAFGFDGGDSSIDVFRNDVAPVNIKNTPQAGSRNCAWGARMTPEYTCGFAGS